MVPQGDEKMRPEAEVRARLSKVGMCSRCKYYEPDEERCALHNISISPAELGCDDFEVFDGEKPSVVLKEILGSGGGEG